MGRLTHRLYVVALTTLHVGGETGLRSIEASTARTILPGGAEQPYIPSTSIRGATRTAAYLAGLEAGLKVCAAIEPREMQERHRRLFGSDLLCPVCGVWGAPNSPSLIHFTDLLPVRGSYALSTITRLELDDYLGKARLGALYSEEVLAPGSLFTGRFWVDTGELQRRVAEGKIGGVNDACMLYKLILSSLLLLPLAGLGRAGVAAAFLEKVDTTDVAKETGCNPDDPSLREMLQMLEWRSGMSISSLIDQVFTSIGERLKVVKKALGQG